jgi:hypothetical protein
MRELIQQILELDDETMDTMDFSRLKSIEKIPIPYKLSEREGILYHIKLEFFPIIK